MGVFKMDNTFASGLNLRTLFEFARNLLLLSDLTFLVQNGYAYEYRYWFQKPLFCHFTKQNKGTSR